MQIRYRNTLDHLVALQKFVLRNTDAGKKMMLHRYIVIEMILVFIFSLFAVNHDRLKVLLVFVMVSAVAWLFRERTVLVQFRRDFKREQRKDNLGMFEKDRVLNIDRNGMRVSIGSNENLYTWDQVELTGRDGKHLYIILKGLLHYVIPLSALEDPTQAERIIATIDAYRAQRSAGSP